MLLADRSPGRVDGDDDASARLLGLGERLGVEGRDGGWGERGTSDGEEEYQGSERGDAMAHGDLSSGPDRTEPEATGHRASPLPRACHRRVNSPLDPGGPYDDVPHG